jgi:hypothetical protein
MERVRPRVFEIPRRSLWRPPECSARAEHLRVPDRPATIPPPARARECEDRPRRKSQTRRPGSVLRGARRCGLPDRRTSIRLGICRREATETGDVLRPWLHSQGQASSALPSRLQLATVWGCATLLLGGVKLPGQAASFLPHPHMKSSTWRIADQDWETPSATWRTSTGLGATWEIASPLPVSCRCRLRLPVADQQTFGPFSADRSLSLARFTRKRTVKCATTQLLSPSRRLLPPCRGISAEGPRARAGSENPAHHHGTNEKANPSHASSLQQ